MRKVLYVGMMWDIVTIMNLHEDVDIIYVMDLIDLTYGIFIEGKENSWETLKEKIRDIVEKGGYYEECYNAVHIINNGGSQIISETEEIYESKTKWNLIFKVKKTGKNIELVFFSGYDSHNIWPPEINDICAIITCGAEFELNKSTIQMINDRCTTPFIYYQLYWNCDKSLFEKIGENIDQTGKEIVYAPYLSEIGKTIITDTQNMSHISTNI